MISPSSTTHHQYIMAFLIFTSTYTGLLTARNITPLCHECWICMIQCRNTLQVTVLTKTSAHSKQPDEITRHWIEDIACLSRRAVQYKRRIRCMPQSTMNSKSYPSVFWWHIKHVLFPTHFLILPNNGLGTVFSIVRRKLDPQCAWLVWNSESFSEIETIENIFEKTKECNLHLCSCLSGWQSSAFISMLEPITLPECYRYGVALVIWVIL